MKYYLLIQSPLLIYFGKKIENFPLAGTGATIFRFDRQFSCLNYSTWKMLNYETNNANNANNAKMHEHFVT